jgi:asparagine synthase (glutamine-hydrolysing)
MSGICGIVLPDQAVRPDAADLSAMVRALDVSGNGDVTVASLGMAVLGGQGFSRRTTGIASRQAHGRSVGLVFHGSLYDGPASSSRDGRQHDPCERILESYLDVGMPFLERLRGDFALALWDGRDETLYLATDRFRVQPLFYRLEQDRFLFASRMRSLAACPAPLSWTVNPEAIVQLVGSSAIPTPHTIFTEVKKLPPGHLLTYQHGTIRLQPYWEISFLHSNGVPERELAQRLRASVHEAVAIRLKTDGSPKRIGTFLSGGVDSSTVTGIMASLTEREVKSFSIGFHETRFDETSYARIAARAFGVEHHELVVTARDTHDVMAPLLEAFDEPFANASAIPTFLCARLAREHGVDILFAGDGGDELFAGNQR